MKTQESSPANKLGLKETQEKYFQQARKSKPFISADILLEKASKKRTTYGRQSYKINKRFGKTTVAIAASLTLISVFLFILVQKEEVTEFKEQVSSGTLEENLVRFEKVSYVREYFMDQLNQKQNSPKVEVKRLFNSHSAALKERRLIPPLKVSPEILKNMGFQFEKTRTIYEANIQGRGYLRLAIEQNPLNGQARHSVNISDNLNFRVDYSSSFYPLFLTKIDGKQPTSFRFNSENKDKMGPTYFDRIFNDLVPIGVPAPNDSDQTIAIMWFSSTPELFEALVTEPIPPASQKEYSEPLPTRKERGGSLTIKGNPFKDHISISYTLSKAGNLKLDVVSIDGQISRSLIQETVKEAGSYEDSYDLSHLKDGVYLLVLSTGNKRITKRILKQN